MGFRTATFVCLLAVLILAPTCAIWADEAAPDAPDLYIGAGYDWDFEGDDDGVDFSIKFSGKSKISPVFGLYNDRLLVGVEYMALGTRAQLKDIYGGAGVIWYEDHFGGIVSLGTHLSRNWIIESSYRVTPDWDGAADIELCYGIDW